MKQILQDLRNGLVGVADVPTAKAGEGRRLIRSRVSLLSAGTERMLLEFGRAGWIERARQQPEKVRQVVEKIGTDGLVATLEAVRAKLDQRVALGYSNVGVDFETGTRLASNGPHAEVVQVPKNLCARVPDNVPDEAAAFTVLGAIALQGIRLAQPTLGETFAVMGLGLIGLLTVQILRGNGCRVVGIDPDPRRVDLARGFGAVTEGTEVDGVIITAATKSSEPVHQAAQMCRKRGRIVLVGVTGLELSREDFYRKELSFQVSCSYGPGRYDPAYEEGGQDYPIGFVRWTAQRNFEAVLGLMAEGKLDVAPLISHRFPFERAEEAYEVILGKEPHLGVLLEYPEKPEEELLRRTIGWKSGGSGRAEARPQAEACPTLALIGAGQHALGMLLPAMRQSGARLKTVADSNGVAAAHAARKFGFEAATTDSAAVLGDPAIDTVFIATRHDSHARLVCEALRAGKNVFVEKPLALNEQELEEIEELGGAESSAQAKACPALVMVGFNRRFAPHVVRKKELLKGTREPKSVICTINAGSLPTDHWAQDPQAGGGRIVGEACHFIDLIRFLVGAPVKSIQTTRLSADTATIGLGYQDGSAGTVHYLANGSRSFPKERIEVFCGGRVLQLDNFRRLTGFGWPTFRRMKLWRQDKGHRQAVAAFVEAIRQGLPSPIAFDELIEVSRSTLQAAR